MAKASETTSVSEARELLVALEALGGSLDLNRSADHVLEGLKSLVSCERAHIFIRDRDSGAITCRRTWENDGGTRAAAHDRELADLPTSAGPVVRDTAAD